MVERLLRGSATTHLALMRALMIVMSDPSVKIQVQRLQGSIQHLAERDPIKLLQDGPVAGGVFNRQPRMRVRTERGGAIGQDSMTREEMRAT